MSAGRKLLGIASAIALVTLLAKAMGFSRELVVAAVFGTSAAKDAYTIAYIVPGFSLVMLGGLTGPFHTTTQKILTTLRQRGDEAAIPAVVAAMLAHVTLVMGAMSIVAYLAAPGLVGVMAAHAKPEVFDLAVAQLRVMSPLLLMGGWIGIFCGISNDRGGYALPSLSPLVASVAVIVTCLWWRDPMALAWGSLLGGVGQVLLQAPAAAKLLFGHGMPGIAFDHPEVRSMWSLLFPATIGSTVGTLAVIIGTYFASQLPTGAIGVFDYANKLIQLPLGILMTALLIPLFPLLTQAAVSGDRDALYTWLSRGLITIAVGACPLVAYFMAAGVPLVRLLYQHGAFEATATAQTATVLAITSLGILAYAIRDLFVRVFYALGDGRTPLLVSTGALAVTAALMAVTVGPYGLPGLALSGVAVTVLNCLTIGWLLRRKLGGLRVREGLTVTGKAIIAAALGGAAAWWVGTTLPETPPLGAIYGGTSFSADIRILAAQALALASVYGLALALMGLPVVQGMRQLASRLRPRSRT